MPYTGNSNGVGYRVDPYYMGSGDVDFLTNPTGGAPQTVHIMFDRGVLAFSVEIAGSWRVGSKVIGYDANGNAIDTRLIEPSAGGVIGRIINRRSFTRYEVRGQASNPLRSVRIIPAELDSLSLRGLSVFSAVTPYLPPPVVITPGSGNTPSVDLATLIQVSTPSVERVYVKDSLVPITSEEIHIRNLSTEIDIRVGLRGAGGVSFEPSAVDVLRNTTVPVRVIFNSTEVNNLREGINTISAILDLTTNTPIVAPPRPVEHPFIPSRPPRPLNKWYEERFHGAPQGMDSTDVSVIMGRDPYIAQWVNNINYLDGSIPAPTSIRWTGKFIFEDARYQCTATYDDGMRVWVDGVLVIDDWASGASRTTVRTVQMSEGEHDLRVEYFNGLTHCRAAVSFHKIVDSSAPDDPRPRPRPIDDNETPYIPNPDNYQRPNGNVGPSPRDYEREWIDNNDGFRRTRDEII